MRKSPILLVTITIGIVGALSSFVAACMVRGPSVSPDEWGYLLNGQVLLGRSETFIPFAKFYGPVYGLVSGAGGLLTGSLHGAYRFDVISNAVLNVLLAVTCARIAVRLLGAPREVGVMAGVVVLVSPGGFVGAQFAWAESLGRLIFVLVVILVWRAAQVPTTSRLVAMGALSGLMPFVHGRFVAVVAATLILMVTWTLARHARAVSVLLATGVLVGVYAAGRVVSVVIRGWLYRGSGAQELRLVRRLLEPALWTDIVRETGGQLWYALAATLGLFLVAAVWMMRHSVLRGRDVVRMSTAGSGAMSLFALSSVAIIVMLGSLQLARAERGDQFIYGRHVEAVLPIFLVVAVVEVAKSGRRLHRIWSWGALSILGVSLVYTVVQRQDIVHQWVVLNGPLRTANILAVDAMADIVGTEGLISLGIGFTLLAMMIVLLHRTVGNWALVCLAAVMFASSLHTSRTTMVERPWMLRSIATTSVVIGDSREVTVGYDGRVLHDKRYFALRYLVHPVQLRWLDVTEGSLTVPGTMNCVYGFADKRPDSGEWRIADREDGIDRVLWIRSAADRC